MVLSTVDILLSTYNGENYLDEQLRSVREQTHDTWRLLARDDGSTDGTVDILRAWADRDSRLRILPGGTNLGAARSFLSLLPHSNGEFFAFCDQDDVWKPNKLATLLSIATADAPRRPLAVFSDAALVDEDSQVISPSFFRHQGIDVARSIRWPRLLAQNVVVGSTLVGNAELRQELLVALPDAGDSVVMHDWWTALVAAAVGRVTYLDQATILYRQHRGNVLGAKGAGLRRLVNNLRRGESVFKPVRYLRRIAKQAACLEAWYGDRLSGSQRSTLSLLADLSKEDFRIRLRDLLRCMRGGVRMTSRDQDLVLAVSVLLFGRFPGLGR